MAKFKVNFSEIENFEPLDAGVYPVIVVDFEEREGPAGPYIVYTLEISEGPEANRKLWTNLSLSPKAAWKLQEALLAFGVDRDDLEAEFDFDPEEFLGAECCAVVSQDTYQDRITNKIDQLQPMSNSPAPTAPPTAPEKAKRKRSRPPKIR